ncbi:MAG TPA: hypothetical protein VHK69_12670 [Chitinophagaceae bacterium]|nr:hypothetical protein [Chitinophagaceae bacterium]
MKCFYCFLLLSVLCGQLRAQSSHPFTLHVGADLQFVSRGFGGNEAGFGPVAEAAFRTHKKWQLHAEGAAAWYWGNKVFYTGVPSQNVLALSLKGGPRFYPLPRLSLSASAGLYLVKVRSSDFHPEDGYQFTLGYLAGPRRQVHFRGSYAILPHPFGNMRYFGLGMTALILRN